MFPLVTLALAIALIGLGYGARMRRGFGPLIAGGIAAAMILTGKFRLALDWLEYGGIALWVAASVWNSWPRKYSRQGSCPACAPGEAMTDKAPR